MRTGKLLIIVTLDAYSRHEKIVECIFIQKKLSPHSLVMIFLKMFANLFVLNGLFNIQNHNKCILSHCSFSLNDKDQH